MNILEAIKAGHKSGKVIRKVAPFDFEVVTKAGSKGEQEYVNITYHNADGTNHKLDFTSEQLKTMPLRKVECTEVAPIE